MATGDKQQKSEALHDIEVLKEKLHRLETSKKRKEELLSLLSTTEGRFREMFENMMNAIAVYRPENDGEDFVFVDFNRAAEAMENISRDQVIGRRVRDVFPGVVEFGIFDAFQRVYRTGEPERFPVSFYEDDRMTGWRENFIYKLPSGEIVAVYSDETERKQQEELIRLQADEILELSTPVLQVWQGILIAPLIGTLDSNRTQRFMEQFLHSIVKTNAIIALLDITGVPAVDTQTAQHLIEAVTAAQLLGARVILTGIRASIAQTLVHLGIDLTNIETRASLAGGMSRALHLMRLEVKSIDG